MDDIRPLRLPGQISEPISHYTDAVQFGDMLWLSGMLGDDAEGNIIAPDDVVAQAEQVHKNIETVLNAAGATFADVVKVTVYLTDITNGPKINPIRRRYFGDHMPASTLVEVSRLAKGALVEIEAVAYLGGKPR